MTKLSRTTRRLGLAALATIPVLGALALSGTSAVASAATAKKSNTSAVTVSQPVPASTAAQTLAYWTQARRDAAKSANVVAGAQPPSSQPAAGPTGPPSSHAGSSPAGVASVSGVATAAQPTEEPVIAAQPWAYPFPYDAFTVPTTYYKTDPYRVNGTIFFTNGGEGFKCSGTSVFNGHNTGEVDTAGHCVASTEKVNKEFDSFAEFIPAYNGNGTTAAQIEPYGTFVANGYDHGDRMDQQTQPERRLRFDVGRHQRKKKKAEQSSRNGRLGLQLQRQRAVRGVWLPGRIALQRQHDGRELGCLGALQQRYRGLHRQSLHRRIQRRSLGHRLESDRLWLCQWAHGLLLRRKAPDPIHAVLQHPLV